MVMAVIEWVFGTRSLICGGMFPVIISGEASPSAPSAPSAPPLDPHLDYSHNPLRTWEYGLGDGVCIRLSWPLRFSFYTWEELCLIIIQFTAFNISCDSLSVILWDLGLPLIDISLSLVYEMSDK